MQNLRATLSGILRRRRAVRLDAVLLVAHPDDDALWAGVLQKSLSFLNWGVVCVTHHSGDPRGREFLAWQEALGTPRDQCWLLNAPDHGGDLPDGTSSFEPEGLAAHLRLLGLFPQLCVTHDFDGEYGHPHHRTVAQAAGLAFPETEIWRFAHYLDRWDVEIHLPSILEEAQLHYPSQADRIARRDIESRCFTRGVYTRELPSSL